MSLGEASDLAGEIAGPGTFALTGYDTLRQVAITAATGVFTVSGQATVRVLSMPAAAGAFTVSGQSVGLERGRRLAASPTILTYGRHPLFAALGQLPLGGAATGGEQATTFAFTGNNNQFQRVAFITAGLGTVAFTGNDVTFTLQAYPSNIRIFPRVGRGIRSFATGRTHAYDPQTLLTWDGDNLVWNGGQVAWTPRYTNQIEWDGDGMTWNGEQVVWGGALRTSQLRGGIIVKTSVGRGLRARAFGG
jgi:hypothetical protein